MNNNASPVPGKARWCNSIEKAGYSTDVISQRKTMNNNDLVRQAEAQLKALKQTITDMENKPDGIPVELTKALLFLNYVAYEINYAISWHNNDSPDKVENFEL